LLFKPRHDRERDCFRDRELFIAGDYLLKLGMIVKGTALKIGSYLVDKLKLAGSKIQAFGAKAKIAAGKLWLLLGPKGLIILAITAVVGAVIGWIANNEEAQKKLLAIWNKIKDFMTPIIEFIGRLGMRLVSGTMCLN
jgi:phage-related minor tail protein